MILTIDNCICDLDAGTPVAIDWSDEAMRSLAAARRGASVTLTLPATPANEKVFRFGGDPHAGELFNATLHHAEILADGARIFSGSVRLLASRPGDPVQGYRIEIRGGAAPWAETAARETLDRLPIECPMQLTVPAVRQSWSGSDCAVRFLPVQHDTYDATHAGSDLLTAERLLSIDDYHPFLSVATVVGAIFAREGYTVESRFMESPLFRSLYFSGAYSSRNTEAVKRRMDFFARRRTECAVTADPLGRVYASPFIGQNSVGNLVDAFLPGTADETGRVLTDVFSTNDSLRIGEDGNLIFRPTTEVSVGFEYHLKYTTGHRILTRNRLQAIDSLYIAGITIPFELPNRYLDRRGTTLHTNFEYLAVVFGHTEGDTYRLCNSAEAGGAEWCTFAGRSAKVVTPAAATVVAPVLYVQHAGQSGWSLYPDDWALYDGYIGERGETVVELQVRTPPEVVTPAHPKRFDTIHFYGGEAGTRFVLSRECTLRPCFSDYPGYGAQIGFADVAPRTIRQAELLEAVQHLFNLRFLTDPHARKVFVEPADDFYAGGATVDWSDRIDHAQPIEVSDLALEVHERRRYGYQAGDGLVTRFNAQAESPFGEWSTACGSCASIMGEERLDNPLFTPTISLSDRYADAPSAWLMQVGDRDTDEAGESGFTPRIVRYGGLRQLPEGERWDGPAGGQAYPLAAFHLAGDGQGESWTLCFEDRDGLQGLHRYYDRQIEQERCCQRIALSVRIEPHEIEQLLGGGTGALTLRSRFRLTIGGEAFCCRLSAIEGYDPAAASTRCIFVRTTEEADA